MRRYAGAGRANARRVVAALAAASLGAGLLAACSGGGADGAYGAPAVSPAVSVRGLTIARPRKVRVVSQAARHFRANRTAWPAASAETVALRAPAAGQAAGPRAGTRRSPVWLQAVARAGTR